MRGKGFATTRWLIYTINQCCGADKDIVVAPRGVEPLFSG